MTDDQTEITRRDVVALLEVYVECWPSQRSHVTEVTARVWFDYLKGLPRDSVDRAMAELVRRDDPWAPGLKEVYVRARQISQRGQQLLAQWDGTMPAVCGLCGKHTNRHLAWCAKYKGDEPSEHVVHPMHESNPYTGSEQRPARPIPMPGPVKAAYRRLLRQGAVEP